MSTTYDWSPLFDAINSGMKQYGQNKQYQGAISSLFQGPQLNPVQVTPQVTAANPAGSPSRQAAYDTPALGPSGPMNGMPQMEALFRNMSPETGMPLLLQSATKMMTPNKYDSTTHDGINPSTGKADQFILDSKGNQKWLGTAPRTKIEMTPAGDAYDPYNTAPGTHFQQRPKAPTTRNIQIGNNNVSQHFDETTGQWVTDGSGPKWAPPAAKAPEASPFRSGPF